MPSPLPAIVEAWFRESGHIQPDCSLIDFLADEMIRRKDFLPLELLAAKAGFILCPNIPASEPADGPPSWAA